MGRLAEIKVRVCTGSGPDASGYASCGEMASETSDSAPLERALSESTMTVAATTAEVWATAGRSIAVGDRIAGRYRILRFLASGAVSQVYAAHDEELDTTVALKALRSDRVEDGVTLARFRREVLLTRELAHPGVCRVFDIGVHDDGRSRFRFLTMELLAGETLAQRLARCGPMTPLATYSLARKLASALDAIHAAGVVHRDLKPANIMLVPDERAPGGERVVITDFGLARRAGPQGEAPPDEPGASDSGGARATAIGALIGSPAYMAPEQVDGGDIGAAADIFSFGVVLFEVVTGRLPYQAASPLAMAISRLECEAPSARTVRPDVDRRWDRVIARCLARDPAARFARAVDVPTALANPPAHRTGRRLPVGGPVGESITVRLHAFEMTARTSDRGRLA